LVKSFTFVRLKEGVDPEAFFERWIAHTHEFDVVDHPYITLNRLMRIQGPTPYVGIAENHWPDMQSLVRTSEFYQQTERGRTHWADLCEFMDIENSPTVLVTQEAEVSEAGITHLIPAPE
jgi:hypothetical protein